MSDKPKSTAKRDELTKIEKEITKEWEDAHLYETTEVQPGQKTFFPTFPFPYMNGRLHLGHTFTLTKAEFAARYHKLKGDAVMFPFGFHCTGMPIKACADKLRAEIETYGNPPVFPKEEDIKQEVKPTRNEAELVGTFKSKKAKCKQKGGKRQWEILKSNGIPENEIPDFVDPLHWLQYFPSLGIQDLKLMGLAVDWRRSFITTDYNPFFNSFARWQLTRLKDNGKIKFGKRNTIFSPKDGQPCADHDRASGEGIGPQEYTAVKMQVVETRSELVNNLMNNGKKVYFIAGTLRPETMYGQTNCWIHPDITYHLFEMKNGDIIVCTRRCGNNLVYQELLKDEPVNNKAKSLGSVSGSELIGTGLKAPLTSYDIIYTLPMTTILEDKGTGVVTSVPSDSPDDYINIFTLQQKPEYRKKLGLEDRWVVPFELVEILEIPELGRRAAETVCNQLKIKSPNDRVLLDQAKEKVYTQGFYNGVLIVGKYANSKIHEAKNIIKQDLLDNNEAFVYSEPTGQVISRSGDECVVALCDQWYISYGDDNEWREETQKRLEKMETYHTSTRETLKNRVDWVKQWACSRTFGLGSKIPWDEKYLIESLSDSTLYMVYYTIAHFLQNDINGHTPNKYNIKAEDLTDDVWDYIFLGGKLPEASTISSETLKAMKAEFETWYPFNVRVTGKDLLTNHCLFCMYTHSALLPEDKFPLGMRANGHLLINNEKMSKQTGNFLGLTDAVDLYTADGMRIGLADAGDAVDDANFTSSTADTGLLRLHSLYQWIKDIKASIEKNKTTNEEPNTFADNVFNAQINAAIVTADVAYEKMLFRDALRAGFYELVSARDAYVIHCESTSVPLNTKLVNRFIDTIIHLLYPIAPHFCDHIWRKILGNSTFLWQETFPSAELTDEDVKIINESKYLNHIVTKFRSSIDSYCNPKAKKGAKPITKPYPSSAKIQIGTVTPPWQIECSEELKKIAVVDGDSIVFPPQRDLAKELSKNDTIKKNTKKAVPFAMMLVQKVNVDGLKALDIVLNFDEVSFLSEMKTYIQNVLKLKSVELCPCTVLDEKLIPGEPIMNNFE